METSADPCSVCGGTDTKLIDGFYYCIECGTQNANVRETIIEERVLADGTFAQAHRRKIIKIQKEGVEMSGEWYKWHAFNFIISGLADELIQFGAKHTFKTKLLWIWTRYIKKYQNKSELMMNKTSNDLTSALPSFMAEEIEGTEETDNENKIKKVTKYDIADGSKRDIRFLTKNVIAAMLYVALNLDECDIQLSHLHKFLQEKLFDLYYIKKYLPVDIDVKKISRWINFLRSKLGVQHQIRALGMSLMRKLDLGTPKVPDLKKIIDNFMLELNLPNDMKSLIYSLIHFRKCNYLDIDKKTQKFLVRIPDYEGAVMAFILVALKMCFGLDCDYEIKLSDAVEKINDEKDLQKSYRIGKYSEPTDRLFSFREWSSHLLFRKVMLGKHNLRIAEKHFLELDDYVYLEHMKDRPKGKEELTDKISMEIISKLPQDDQIGVIPKELFPPTLTPMSEYTGVVIDHCQDPEVKLLLAEDFKSYSLKYACENLSLLDSNSVNIIKGVSSDRKTKGDVILGTISMKKSKRGMVYVKNCENRNWMITKPPTIEHITTVTGEDESDDKDSDHGYDSENTPKDKEIVNIVEESVTDHTTAAESEKEITITIETKKQEMILEEDEDKNIFDDCFVDLTIKEECDKYEFNIMNAEESEINKIQDTIPDEDFDRRSNISDDSFLPVFNPETFDRESTIKELILFACKKYKIPIPAEYRITEPRKRKQIIFDNEGNTVKRCRRAKYDGNFSVNDLLSSYHDFVQSDFMTRMQQEINMAIRNSELTNQDLPHGDNLPNSSLNDIISATHSSNANALESTIAQSDRNSPMDERQMDINNKSDTGDKIDIIDENLENSLFENVKMNIDDMIEKGDPNFDEEKYDIDQLYIKIKDVKPDTCFDIKNDAEIDEILSNDKEIRAHDMESKIKENAYTEKNEESESEDEVPLSIIKNEIMLTKQMYLEQENYEKLIKNEDIPEFKYWARHYDSYFMSRSKNWYVKFNEELKENVPSSFCFVLQECASILNCSNFHLYKQLQRLEEYYIAKSKKLKFKSGDASDCFSEESEDVSE